MMKTKKSIETNNEDINKILKELKRQNLKLLEKEKILHETNNELNFLFDEAPSPYITIDKNLNILNFNKQAKEYFSINTHTKSLYCFIEKDKSSELFLWINNCKYIKKELEIEIKVKENRRLFRIKANKHPNRDDILFLFFIDIQNQYEIKSSLENQLKKESKNLHVTKNILISESKLASMGEIIRSIAHQWRQPLNHISLLTMQLEYEIADNKEKISEKYLKKHIKDVNKSLEKLSYSIDYFLKFLKPSLKKEIFYVHTIYDDLVKFLNFKINHDSSIEINFSKKETKIKSYKNDLTHILLLLINNAIDSRTKSTTLLIEINHFYENNNLVIEVSDKKEEKTLYKSKKQLSNKWLGLNISRSIIERRFKGSISVLNKKGKNRTTIKLPNVKSD